MAAGEDWPVGQTQCSHTSDIIDLVPVRIQDIFTCCRIMRIYGIDGTYDAAAVEWIYETCAASVTRSLFSLCDYTRQVKTGLEPAQCLRIHTYTGSIPLI